MTYSARTFLLQTGLKVYGFDFGTHLAKYGPIDGREGDKTRAAIAAFEASPAGREASGADKLPADPVKPPTNSDRRQINAAGLELVTHFEGLFLKAYLCPAGVWTIGYGHTGLTHRDGTVKAGRTITKEEAEKLLLYDLEKFSARVQGAVKVPLTDNQFSALVSFDFNTGGLLKSSLLKKLNAGDYQGAADGLLAWTKANGKELAGLVRRRKSERNLFLNIQPFIVK
jgi:GH24 family phage-related lysozyme (muramidase)